MAGFEKLDHFLHLGLAIIKCFRICWSNTGIRGRWNMWNSWWIPLQTKWWYFDTSGKHYRLLSVGYQMTDDILQDERLGLLGLLVGAPRTPPWLTQAQSDQSPIWRADFDLSLEVPGFSLFPSAEAGSHCLVLKYFCFDSLQGGPLLVISRGPITPLL